MQLKTPVLTKQVVKTMFSGDFYLIMCELGFERDGEEMLLCESGGFTNISTHPVCREVPEPCQKPNINNGWITTIPSQDRTPELYSIYENLDDLILYEEESIVVCSQPNYGPPHTRVTCKGNNQFEPPIPICVYEGE